MKKMYRQGDVLLVKVDDIPKKVKQQKSNVVVEGEATGHAHRLHNGQILIYKDEETYENKETMFINAMKNAKLVHEEHGPIEIEVGFYMVIRQREYDEEKNRLVFD